MIKGAILVEENPDANALASTSLVAMMKISLYAEAFWHDFKNAAICSEILRQLVLENPKWAVRRRSLDYLKTLCLETHL